jgi:hypothetical protein
LISVSGFGFRLGASSLVALGTSSARVVAVGPDAVTTVFWACVVKQPPQRIVKGSVKSQADVRLSIVVLESGVRD